MHVHVLECDCRTSVYITLVYLFIIILNHTLFSYLYKFFLNFSLQDRIGFNLSALQLLQLRLEDQQSDQLFTDATDMFKKKEKRRKSKHKGPNIV